MSANSPQYFGNSLRLIAMRNGLWVGQRCYGTSTREYDAWQTITRPADYETILARTGLRMPVDAADTNVAGDQGALAA
jgi:hypothetical protein